MAKKAKYNDPAAAFGIVMDKAVEIIREEMEAGLAYLGEECVKRIREQGRPNDWEDQTGNLRSSIGYAVFEYGREVFKSAFKPVNGAVDGSQKGSEYVDSLAQKYADVYALVVVAGMDYANYVETKRDVLAGTELWAKGRIEKVLEKFKQRAEKRISALL